MVSLCVEQVKEMIAQQVKSAAQVFEDSKNVPWKLSDVE